MAVTLVKPFGKHRIVCGLAWYALAAATEEEAQVELRALADRQGTKFGLQVDALGGTQVRRYAALVPKEAPKNARGGVSGAAWLAQAVERPTLLLGEVDNGRWWIVLTQSGGAVDVDTDVVVPAADVTARVDALLDRLLRSAVKTDIPDVVIAGHDEVESQYLKPGGVPWRRAEFSDLVVGAPADDRVRIRQLSGLSQAALAGILAMAALLALAIAGWFGWKHIQAQREAEREIAAAQARAAEAARIKTLTDVRIREAVERALAADTGTPSPGDRVVACVDAFTRFGFGLGGFAPDTLTCDERTDSLTLKLNGKMPGDNALLADATAADANISVGLTAQGQSASVSAPAEPMRARVPLGIDALPRRQAVMTRFIAAIQRFRLAYPGDQVSVSEPVPKAINYDDPTKSGDKHFSVVPAGQGYSAGAIHVNGTSINHLLALRETLDYPFVSIKQMTIHPVLSSAVTWSLEATYAVSSN